ncbi:MAG: isoprenyl transferase [Crocinitomicaceae bacterium]|nr:isoprenyl transferase [Crocinitomicaceae bacterium]
MNIETTIDLTKVPQHVALIMDGNGRWAKKQGQERLFGHSIGVEAIRGTLKAATRIGVKYLTFYAFSTENWSRPQAEVDGLMNLMVKTIASEVDELNTNGVRLISIGDIQGLPADCREELEAAIDKTKENDTINVILALNYSSKWEITQAMKKIAAKIENGTIDSEGITEELISNEMCLQNIPDPELLIRTSGEQRLSNFLLWQCAYTEFYFTDVLWPDFKENDLYQAVINYQHRERRFGKVSEQLI